MSENVKKKNNILSVKRYFSGFEDAEETYNAITEASDGNIYYILCSTRHDVGAQMYLSRIIHDKL